MGHQINRSARSAAFHEAGHAVFAWLYGLDFDSITIAPGEENAGMIALSDVSHLRKTKGGWTRFRTGEDMMSVAGPVAEAIFLGSPYIINDMPALHMGLLFSDTDILTDEDGAMSDHSKVWAVFRMMKERPEIWSAVTALAQLLIDVETVSGKRASRVIRQHVPIKWPRHRKAS